MQPFQVLMPRVEPRKEWERLKKANARNAQPLGPPLAFCHACTVGIGRHYVQRELYVLPVARVRKRRPTTLTWQKVCGVCALEEYELAFGYCVVAEHDWEMLDEQQYPAYEAAKLVALHEYLLQHWPSDHINERLRRLVPPVAHEQLALVS